MQSHQKFLYDDALDYTDGFVMEASIQFDTPDENLPPDATTHGLCIQNENRNQIKSCFVIKWRNDRDSVANGFYFNGYL